jgi:hypothetical protein
MVGTRAGNGDFRGHSICNTRYRCILIRRLRQRATAPPTESERGPGDRHFLRTGE